MEKVSMLPKNMQHSIHLIHYCVFIFMSIVISGCGGSSSSSDSNTDVVGIEGTGSPTTAKTSVGTITQTGDLEVNGVNYDTSEATVIIDGQQSQTNDLSLGQIVVIDGSINEDGQTGIAHQITFSTNVLGPIELINNEYAFIKVLGQLVSIDNNTVFEGITNLSELQEQDIVQVSGYITSTNQFVASYIKRLNDQDSFEVTGVISNLDTQQQTFNIEGLTIDYSNAPSLPSLANDMLIEVQGSLIYSNNGSTFIATMIQVVTTDIGKSGDALQLQGLVTQFNSSTEFSVSKIPVRLADEVQFFGGHTENLELDVRVIVDGIFNDQGILIVTQVDFFSGVFRHVDQNHPEANDENNPGTKERPWRTIQHAVNSAFPGDTILVHEGTYKELGVQNATGYFQGITFENSGKANQSITRNGIAYW